MDLGLKVKESYWTWSPDTAGAWQCINIIQQGYTERTRIGAQITIKNIYMRWSSQFASAHTAVNLNRQMLFIDSQANGDGPTLAEMFLTLGSVYTCWSEPLMWTRRGRFTTLYDTAWSASAQYGGAAMGNDSLKLGEFYQECNITVNYTGNAGTIDDIGDNALWVFGKSMAAAGSINLADTATYTRLEYIDS